jgi:hypothetical protein
VVNQCANYCADLTQVSDTQVTGSTASVALPADTPRGALFEVRAKEINTAGESAWTTTIATYDPLVAPLPPASVTLTPRAGGHRGTHPSAVSEAAARPRRPWRSA